MSGTEGGSAAQQQQGVDLSRLTLEQLSMLREQLDKDTERLSESFQQLQSAVKRFSQAGRAVKTLGDKKKGKHQVLCENGFQFTLCEDQNGPDGDRFAMYEYENRNGYARAADWFSPR